MIPLLTPEECSSYWQTASTSPRHRAHKIYHNPGDFHNKVMNFVLEKSYMQPHCHPGNKSEVMYPVSGEFLLIYFDDKGTVTDTHKLSPSIRSSITVPSGQWHTYIMLTQRTMIFETMDGIYDPQTWKIMAPWAPAEALPEASNYHQSLYQYQ